MSSGVIVLSSAARPELTAAAQQLFPELRIGGTMHTACLPEGWRLDLAGSARLLPPSPPRGKAAPPFAMDLLAPKLRWRIQHPGAEALLRACLNKLAAGSCVWDASAGLGRDALMLSSRGSVVDMFERHPIVYLLLLDALLRAQEAAAYPFALPRLHFGAAADAVNVLPPPAVIYYDPMFPPRRKEALVKKDMQIFHQLVGIDEDIVSTAQRLRTCCTKRLVIKRPAGSAPVQSASLQPSYSVDGGGCRFDCYLP